MCSVSAVCAEGWPGVGVVPVGGEGSFGEMGGRVAGAPSPRYGASPAWKRPVLLIVDACSCAGRGLGLGAARSSFALLVNRVATMKASTILLMSPEHE